jgi:hypothetical protein
MSIDVELDTWRRQWQADPAQPHRNRLAADLKERVARDSRRMMIGLVAPVLVTAVIGGGMALQALQTLRAADIVLALEVWLFILVTWVGCIRIARGTWRPLAETTAAFVDLSIRRCRANLRSVPFGLALYVCQLIIVVLLRLPYALDWSAVLTAWPTVVLGVLVFPALVAAGIWFTRKQRAKLDRLLDLQRQLVGE